MTKFDLVDVIADLTINIHGSRIHLLCNWCFKKCIFQIL